MISPIFKEKVLYLLAMLPKASLFAEVWFRRTHGSFWVRRYLYQARTTSRVL